jgi:uncharacterized protein YeaO (DUF488 family)
MTAMSYIIRIKRVYAAPAREDGRRVLVDRLWPRGLTKEAASIDEWMKDLGPSTALRTWFGHLPERWDGFQQRYREELGAPASVALLEQLEAMARTGPLTLVFGARDDERNQAAVIAETLRTRLAARG